MATPSSSTSSPLQDPQYSNLIHLLRTKLPQELFEQIESTVYEMVFCTGYLYFDVSTIDSEAIEENVPKFRQPLKVARPELLCLSQEIYQNYAVRMWQENICIVTTESGKVREIELARGYLENPLGYLEFMGKDLDTLWALHLHRLKCPMHPMCPRPSRNSEPSLADYNKSVKFFGLYLRKFKEETAGPLVNNYPAKFPFMDCYGPSGEWLGVEMHLRTLWDNCYQDEHERNFKIMWKVVSVMTGRVRDCHRDLLPEMANQRNKLEVEIIKIRRKMYIFT